MSATVRLTPSEAAAGFGTSPKLLTVTPPKDGADLIGAVLADRYVVDAVIGAGGMGTVYR